MSNWFGKSLSFNLKYLFTRLVQCCTCFYFQNLQGSQQSRAIHFMVNYRQKTFFQYQLGLLMSPFHSICCISPSRTPLGEESFPFFIGSSVQHVFYLKVCCIIDCEVNSSTKLELSIYLTHLFQGPAGDRIQDSIQRWSW